MDYWHVVSQCFKISLSFFLTRAKKICIKDPKDLKNDPSTFPRVSVFLDKSKENMVRKLCRKPKAWVEISWRTPKVSLSGYIVMHWIRVVQNYQNILLNILLKNANITQLLAHLKHLLNFQIKSLPVETERIILSWDVFLCAATSFSITRICIIGQLLKYQHTLELRVFQRHTYLSYFNDLFCLLGMHLFVELELVKMLKHLNFKHQSF